MLHGLWAISAFNIESLESKRMLQIKEIVV